VETVLNLCHKIVALLFRVNAWSLPEENYMNEHKQHLQVKFCDDLLQDQTACWVVIVETMPQKMLPVHIELPYMTEPLDFLSCHFSAVVVDDDDENMWMGWHIV